MHSSLCVFSFLKNFLSSTLTTSWHILDRFLSIEPSFSFLDRSSTDYRSIEEFSFALYLLDSISTASWSIEISGFLAQHILNSFFDPSSKILVLFVCSIDSWQILNPLRPSFSRWQILDRSLIDSFLSKFSTQQIVDRNLDPSRCILFL